jgi:hypothetical protein
MQRDRDHDLREWQSCSGNSFGHERPEGRGERAATPELQRVNGLAESPVINSGCTGGDKVQLAVAAGDAGEFEIIRSTQRPPTFLTDRWPDQAKRPATGWA